MASTTSNIIRSLVINARGRLAWKLSDIATPILRTASRLCEDVPCDFWTEFEEGRAHEIQNARTMPTREEAERLFRECDLPTDDATMARFGFTPTASFSGSSTVDEIFDAGRDFERGAQR